MILKSIYLLVLVVFSTTFSFSQETIEEVKSTADKLFEDEKYLEATPYYLRLLAIEPRNHNYNFRYGTCLLYNTSKGQDVFKYLNYAVTNEAVEVEAYYFLAKAFHLNYQFNDAIKYYKIYQTKAAENAKQVLDVKRQIEMCENGKRLITTITEMVVIDKKEIEVEKFFRIYDLSNIGGNLLVTAEFQTKIDEKKAHIPLIHFPENPTVIYYSSYGDNGKTGKDIYVRRRLPTGGWGVPQAIQGGVNTNFDEDYPYMHPDGNYLYFSSKGHNSMGGFDVFRCKYDAETDVFGMAENIDYAVSSPDDDLFYVVDSLNKNAYFASGRQSEEGKLFVYKVRVDRVPLNMSVVKGQFSSTINAAQKNVFVDVKDYATGEFIGNFNSNDKGVYLITFPKGGKYEFTIKVGDSPQEYKYIASIPFLKEFKPLKQKIIHAMDGDRENVKVIDLFDEQMEDPQAVFAQVLKLKAVLAPNISQEEIALLDKDLKSKQVLEELGIGKLSLVEVGYLLDEEVKDAEKAQGGTAEIENKVNTQIIGNSKEINRLDLVIKSKLDKANVADSDKKKYKLLKEADRALKLQEDLKLLNEVSLKYADSISKIPVTGSEAKTAEVKKFAQHFNELLKDNKQKEAYAYLYDNKIAIKNIIDVKAPDPLQDMIDRGLILDNEINRLQPKDDQYARDIKKIELDIATLEQSKVTAKNKDLADIQAAIKSKMNEKNMITEERNFNGVGLNDKITERSSLRKRIDILAEIYDVKADKIISKEELTSALASSKATNSAAIRKELGEEITSLLLKSPDIKEIDYSEMEGELGSVVTKSRTQSDKIKTDPSLTAEQKATKLNAVNAELLTTINKEVSIAKKAVEKNPTDPNLKAKLDALQFSKSLVAASLDIPSDEVDAEVVTSTVSNGSSTNPTSTSVAVNSEKPTNGTTRSEGSVKPPIVTDSPKTEVTKNTEVSATVPSTESKSGSTSATTVPKVSAKGGEVASSQSASTTKSSASDVNKNNEDLKASQAETNSASRENETAKATNSSPLTVKEKELLVETVNPSYNEKVEKISSNSSLSAVEKLKQLQDADNELLSGIEVSISKTESELKKAPSDSALKDKLTDFKAVQSDLTAAISKREKEIGTNGISNSINPISVKEKETLVESVNSSYNEQVTVINTSGSLSETDKLNQLQALDKGLLTAVTSQLTNTELAAKNSPTDPVLAKKAADLKTVQSDLTSAISARDRVISAIGQPSSQKAKTEIIDGLSPMYAVKVADINKNTTISEPEKLAQLQKADKELLISVNKEISALENNVKNNADPQLIKELGDYKSLKNELESAISTRENTIVATTVQPGKGEELTSQNRVQNTTGTSTEPANTSANKAPVKNDEKINTVTQNDPAVNQKESNLTSQNSVKQTTSTSAESPNNTSNKAPIKNDEKSNLIESVNSSYNEEVAKVNANNSLTSNEKLNQIQLLDRSLIESITKELKTTSDTKKKENLASLKKELEGNITARELVIAANFKPVDKAVKANVIKSIDSKYDKKVEAINTNADLSISEKLTQLHELDFEVISKIKQEISEVTADLAKKPTDALLIKKIEDLKAVQADLEHELANRESVIAATTTIVDEKAKAELIESVSSQYNEKVQVLKNNEYLLDSEKQAEYQKIDQQLLQSIEKEIVSLEGEMTSNPSNSQSKRKLEGLKIVKSDLQKSISVREKSLAPESALSNPLAANAGLIETISKGYTEKLTLINEDAFISHTDKLIQFEKLDKELQLVLNKEVTKSISAAKKKPNDPELQKRKNDLIALKKILDEVVNEAPQQILNSLAASVTDQQKNTLISDVKPGHEGKTQGIKNSSKEPIKIIEELIIEEKALISKLEAEEKINQVNLKKEPKNEDLKRKSTVITVAIEESELRISALNSGAVTLTISAINQKALVSKVDPTFESDVKTLFESTSPTKASDLSNREDKLQEKILAQIAINNEEIANNYTVELAAENQILNQKLIESKARKEKYKTGGTDVSVNKSSAAATDKVNELRNDLLAKDAGEVSKNYTKIDELHAQEEILEAYKDTLKSRLDNVNQSLLIEKNEPTLLEQKESYTSELTIVDSKLKQVTKAISGIEESAPVVMNPELKKIMDHEGEIKEQLAKTDLAKKERASLEKELIKVQKEKSVVENKLITENITTRKADNQTKSTQLTNLAATSDAAKLNADLATSQNKRLTAETDVLIAQAEKTKDPLEKNKLLNQAIVKQVKADNAVQNALKENATLLAIKSKVETLDSKEQLEQKKVGLEQELTDLSAEVDQLNVEISSVKPTKSADLIKKKDGLVSEKTLITKQLELVTKQIDNTVPVPTTISSTAIEQIISTNEEKSLIASKEYLEYAINAKAAIRVEGEIKESEATLTEKRQIAKDLIVKSLDKKNAVLPTDIAQAVENVKIVEDEISTLKQELAEKQKNASTVFAGIPDKKGKLENLLKREIEPSYNKDLAEAEAKRMEAEGLTIEAKKAEGIEIVPVLTPINIYSSTNPIPVDVKNGSGLLYRIQVGAFSKPIAQDMYKSFTPVSGEKLSSGVTRYMAGYFNKNVIAEEAHTQVKALGYMDAFIVAYCDDKRIPLAEAKSLEASGECISTKSELFVIATSKMPSATSMSKEPNTTDLSYNIAPGAAKATPVESHLGLFYTVQVGVYNKPATAKQLKNIDPLVTKRLPNGQIRYSSGMFNSIEAAKPKKADARAKGVKDAFISAYYKGERITLSQASLLLKKNGEGILEKLDNELVSSVQPAEKIPDVIPAEKSKAAVNYNVGPGAVKATAVETKLGLFFTVQIGVYSKPATKKQLNNVTDLITKKLPNGQLRYSCGMYNSIEAAEPKRQEALSKGVNHAYITAYFQGERITISEAKELLRINGDSILEKIEK